MFKYFKAKKAEAQFKAAIWGKIYNVVSNFPDIVELAQKTKGMNITDTQKLIVDALVEYAKSKEEPKDGE
jgi:predicted HAD superfamily phosphohydrolase